MSNLGVLLDAPVLLVQLVVSGILVGAPHTSNWDWVATMLIAWGNGRQPKLLIKESFFKGPLAPVMRWNLPPQDSISSRLSP